MSEIDGSRKRSTRAAAGECSKFLSNTAKDQLSIAKDGSLKGIAIKEEYKDAEVQALTNGNGSSSVARRRGRSTAVPAGSPANSAAKTTQTLNPVRASKRSREADAVRDEEDLEMEIANIMVRRLKHKPFRRIPLDMTMTGIWYLPVPSQEAF